MAVFERVTTIGDIGGNHFSLPRLWKGTVYHDTPPQVK